jgi:hypothetical protein
MTLNREKLEAKVEAFAFDKQAIWLHNLEAFISFFPQREVVVD